MQVHSWNSPYGIIARVQRSLCSVFGAFPLVPIKRGRKEQDAEANQAENCVDASSFRMNFITSFQAERLLSQIRGQADPNSSQARKALEKLGNLGAGAIPRILDTMQSADRRQRDSLGKLLTRLLSDRTLLIVARGLASDDPKTVKSTTQALTGSKNYNVNQLVTMLGEDDYSKPAIVEILSAHKERLNISRLFGQLNFLEPNEKAAVFRLIGEIATEEALPELLPRLGGRDALIKTHLIDVVSRFDRPDVHQALEQQLGDSNKLVRQAALAGVSRMNGAISVEAVCALLLDNDLDVMNKAVEVVISMNRPDTVKYLLPALKSENEFSRRSAVEVLNEIGSTESVKDLLEAVADDDWWVRSRASDALARIGGDRVRDAVLELITDKNEDIRRAAIEIIVTCADKSAVDKLMHATRDPDWWVSERAADALASIGDTRAIPALLAMLERNDRSLPVAISALGKLGDTSVIKTLLPFIRRKEKEVSIAAIDAVTQLSDDRLAEGVKGFLRKSVGQNTDATIVQAAERAIQALDGKLNNDRADSGSLSMSNAGRSGSTTSSTKKQADASTASEFVDSTSQTLLGTGPNIGDTEEVEPPTNDPNMLDITTLEHGDIIEGRYKYIEKIGKGAFGTVLLVEDTVVEERLILKFLNPNVASDEEMMKRFVHELRYSRRITHKNVIRIYDFLYIGGGYAISMEYFPSHTLGAEIAKQRPMPVEKAVNYALDVCVGMQIAHLQGIVHRDLKPANILINDDGLLKIVDFGVAAAAKSGDTQLTKTGYVIGSPKYMAPEQILGKKVDVRADIYSLGIILYEMLLGTPPYSRGDHMSVMYQHVQGKAPALSEADKNISQEISNVVLKAMSVDKSKRFDTMVEFQDALTEAAQVTAGLDRDGKN